MPIRKSRPQAQYDLTTQIEELAEAVKAKVADQNTVFFLRLPKYPKVATGCVIADLRITCYPLANELGLYDAADYIRYSLLPRWNASF